MWLGVKKVTESRTKRKLILCHSWTASGSGDVHIADKAMV